MPQGAREVLEGTRSGAVSPLGPGFAGRGKSRQELEGAFLGDVAFRQNLGGPSGAGTSVPSRIHMI